MKSKSRIIKFGAITENSSGILVASGFSCDGVGEFDRSDVALLSLIKRRIDSELDKLLKIRPDKINHNSFAFPKITWTKGVETKSEQ